MSIMMIFVVTMTVMVMVMVMIMMILTLTPTSALITALASIPFLAVDHEQQKHEEHHEVEDQNEHGQPKLLQIQPPKRSSE